MNFLSQVCYSRAIAKQRNQESINENNLPVYEKRRKNILRNILLILYTSF